MFFWEGETYETRHYGVVRIERASGRSSCVGVRCWGRELPVFGGVDRGRFVVDVSERDLVSDVVRRIVRFADLGGCWVDPGVMPGRRPS